jgi:hypothetical protein
MAMNFYYKRVLIPHSIAPDDEHWKAQEAFTIPTYFASEVDE